ncbi:hypothetical protein [Burkholderia ubonensis]|uniref:hypothetical protein n=1 Tax=Burkholderia ubonensis TaxID=101571 RepID=UPI00075473B9|nr:hypothetical protein [Burkholderia ubonensis]KVA19541.1 hypothetical protein WI42_14650 [Burkholderia ubonensis]KVA32750.1 hypothetical protein WI43_02275 [Burkholderia ubonensis]KVA38712.1 hypothetical protein WI46_17480 [Burkholderia ubonensis]
MRELHPRPRPPRPLPATPRTFLLAATLLYASATARWPLPKERAAGRLTFGCQIFDSEASPVEGL